MKNTFKKPFTVEEFPSRGIPIRRTRVQSEQAAETLGKEPGLYITIETGPLDSLTNFEDACACVAEQLHPLLAPFFGKTLCICGLGNGERVFDSLGPATAKRILPNAYDALSIASNFKKIAVLCPDVSGHTNLSSETIIASVADAIDAGCILTIDSSSCKEIENLCSCIEITDTGMQSHWGAASLRQATLGVPVLSIGVPTVIDSGNLPATHDSAAAFLTPIHVADAIDTASFLIACAITQIAYPTLDYALCKQYIELFLYGIA